ncbi:hypothetical protein C0J52_01311 [Blattella germanica]|nr:hypothetical protein C0J52_01311 [Blattella germanica]
MKDMMWREVGKMMHNLLLEEGDFLQIESVSLPVATFSRFQPQSSDFLDITNPKAVLENGLRSFACLTTNDVIAIKYNQRIYELLDGKKKKESPSSSKTPMKVAYQRGIPDYNYKIGTLRFIRNSRPPSKENKEPIEEFKAFTGEGFSLRQTKGKK